MNERQIRELKEFVRIAGNYQKSVKPTTERERKMKENILAQLRLIYAMIKA